VNQQPLNLPTGATRPKDDAKQASVTVHVVDHPRGCIMRIGHDGGTIHLNRDEAMELYELLQCHLGEMPVKL
jgi:hypothetical protein